jgi:hypothetical protein
MTTKTKKNTKTPTVATAPEKKPTSTITPKPDRFADFVLATRRAVNERLEGYFKDFIEDGLPEEKGFLNEVFCMREGGFGNKGVKAFGQHEVPLFSAIQDQLDGRRLVPVESDEMVLEVEKFITDKIAAGWKEPKRSYGRPRETEDEICARMTKLVTRQFELFTSRCKRADLSLVSDLLEQWEALTDNPEFWKNTEYPLAAAIEIQLDVFRRREKERLEYKALEAQQRAA